MLCPNCQQENPDKNAFCIACGSPLRPGEEALTPVKSTCPECGQTLREGAQFCTNCGARQAAPVGELPDKPLPEPSGEVGDSAESGQEGNPPGGGGRLKWILIGVLALAVLCVGAYFLFFRSGAPEEPAADIVESSETAAPALELEDVLSPEALEVPGPGPELTPMTLLEVDATSYPQLICYLAVTDAGGEINSGLSADEFSLLTGGEITGVLPLEGLAVDLELVVGLDIGLDEARDSLAAFMTDQSQSNRVALSAYAAEAELVADYTDGPAALAGDIEALEPDSGSALYDALCAALERAGEQSGSRCVMAVTTGEDGSSDSTAEDVIRLARETGASLVLIGVGDDCDMADLTGLTDQVGGHAIHLEDGQLGYLGDTLGAVQLARQSCYLIAMDADGYSLTLSAGGRQVSRELPAPATAAVDMDFSEIDDLLAGSAGSYSVAVADLNNDALYLSENAEEAAIASSMVTVPLLFTVADRITWGDLSLEDEVVFSYTVSGRTHLTAANDGMTYTVEELLSYALQYSDNNAINSLIDHLTMSEINSVCGAYGFDSVTVAGHLGSSGPENYVSAADLTGMLVLLYGDEFELGRDFMDQYMRIADSQGDMALRRSVPAGSTCLNHNGVRDDLYNEFALVYRDGMTYLVVALSSGADQATLASTAAGVGELVHGAFS